MPPPCGILRSRHRDVLSTMLLQPSIESLTSLCRRRDGSTYTTPLEMGSGEQVAPSMELLRGRKRLRLCPNGEEHVALVHTHPALKIAEGMVPWRPDVPTPSDLYMASQSGAGSLCVLASSTRKLSCYGVEGLDTKKAFAKLGGLFVSDELSGGNRYVRELDRLPRCSTKVGR